LGNANHGDDSGIFYVDTHAGAGLYEVKALYDPNSWGKEASHKAVGFVL
jgi:23S rRNA A2030 N6-methylase RlmJ